MLANVVARSRPEAQLVENTEGPKGFEEPRKLFGRCGIDPARKRDRTFAFGLTPTVAVRLFVSMPDKPCGRNGLVDGVGLDVLDMRDCGWELAPIVPTGENREGTVPALALRAGLFNVGSEVIKSGKPS